jgi:L-seryl-tRNA(Ser) seleniumtransferase
VLFSGDKLLGGPQAGCGVGRRLAVEACRKNPLYRALRVGRLVASGLESTLWAHATGRLDDIPVMAQLRLDAAVVGERARRMAAAIGAGLAGQAGLCVDVVEDASTSGGGSSPSSRIPTFVLRLSGPSLDVERVSARLRSSRPALIGRIAEDRLILDARTIPPERDDEVARLLVAAVQATTT